MMASFRISSIIVEVSSALVLFFGLEPAKKDAMKEAIRFIFDGARAFHHDVAAQNTDFLALKSFNAVIAEKIGISLCCEID